MTQGKQCGSAAGARGARTRRNGGSTCRCPGQCAVIVWRLEGLVEHRATPGILQMGLERQVKGYQFLSCQRVRTTRRSKWTLGRSKWSSWEHGKLGFCIYSLSLILSEPQQIGAIIIPCLQMRKLRPWRDLKNCPVHTVK